MLKPRDEFRIIYNNLTLKEVSNEWIKYETANLDQIICRHITWQQQLACFFTLYRI